MFSSNGPNTLLLVFALYAAKTISGNAFSTQAGDATICRTFVRGRPSRPRTTSAASVPLKQGPQHPRVPAGNALGGRPMPLSMSSWDDFAYDDEDELLDAPIPLDASFVAADENDDPSVKAAAGMSLEPPEVYWDGPVIQVPQGSVVDLTEENVQGLLAACREEIGTMFGYQAENRGVGITGGVDFVEMDGPTVVLHLKGRFWHQRTTVLSRVKSYLIGRIPEIVDVIVEDEYELTDEANNEAI